MQKKIRTTIVACMTGVIIATSVLEQVPIRVVYANEFSEISDVTRAEIEASLYDFEYYTMANEDVAVALNYDEEKMYEHWLNFGMVEGRNASMVFNAKYYLEVNPEVKALVGNDYIKAYEHFVTEGLLAGLESSPVFSVKYYLEANQDVAQVFGNDYVKAANHFNQNALAEGRSGSGNFDYTVYKDCNTDVAALYGDEIKGYYIHYINHGRAEGRTGSFAINTENGTTGENNITSSSIQTVTEIFSEKLVDNDIHITSLGSEVSPVSQFVTATNGYGVAYHGDGIITVLLYTKELELYDKVTIESENATLGAVTSDENGYFYAVYGIKNETDDVSKEVMRVVKYSSDGKKIGSVSYTGNETGHQGISYNEDGFGTKNPFDFGNCSLLVKDDLLVCNYARVMYNGHQSNNVLYVDTNIMEKVDRSPCYTSHTFDQQVISTTDGGFLFADQGDAFGRAFVVHKLVKGNSSWRMGGMETFHFREGGNAGYQNTFSQLGGICELPSSYILVGASERTLSLDLAPADKLYGGYNEARDLFIQYLKKDFTEYSGKDCYVVEGETREAEGTKPENTSVPLYLREDVVDYGVIWLTDYEDEYLVYNPKVVTTKAGDVIILWQKVSYATEEIVDTYCTILDEKGNYIQEPVSLGVIPLSTDEPVVYLEDSIYWSVTEGTNLTTYRLEIPEKFLSKLEDKVSYRIFDAQYYLQHYPILSETVGTEELDLYLYWINVGIHLGQSASSVLVPVEYLQMNTDVAKAVDYDFTVAIVHFLEHGIYEGRSGSREFDYTVYQYCNTDVGDVFGDDIVGYYYHYVKHGKAEGRTARLSSTEELPSLETITVVPKGTTKFITPDGITVVINFKDGRMNKQKLYNAEGVLQEELEYYYFNDEENTYVLRRLPDYECIVWNSDYSDGAIKSKAEDGLKGVFAYIEILSKNEDGTFTVEYKKITEGIVDVREYDEKGTLLSGRKEIYDEMSNLSEVEFYTYHYEQDTLMGWMVHVYDAEYVFKQAMEYDAEGNLISVMN